MPHTHTPQYWVVIPAAGIGQRMQADCPKQYIKISDKTILEHTLKVFDRPDTVSGIVLSLAEKDPYWPDVKAALGDFSVSIYEANGGEQRCDSVLNALECLKEYAHEDDWVLVHDAARPCVAWTDVLNLIIQLKDEQAGGLLASPVKDTIKQSDANGHVAKTVDRSDLWRALTPQMFKFSLLYKALQQANDNNQDVTDDASALELFGFSPLLVEGSSDNIKITTPDDIAIAEAYLKRSEKCE